MPATRTVRPTRPARQPSAPTRRGQQRLLWVSGALAQCLAQFRGNLLRTFLTLLGVVFGVGSVIAMGSIGEGAQQEIVATIEAMGAAVTHVKAKEIEPAKQGDLVNDSVGLCRDDALALSTVLGPLVRRVAYRASYDIRVSDLAVPRAELLAYAVSSDFLVLHNLSVSDGRLLLPTDHEHLRRVVLLGAKLARRAFGSARAAVGRRIRLDYAYFDVVGVLADRLVVTQKGPQALPIDPERYSGAVLLPIETAEEELGALKTYGALDQLSFQVHSTEQTLLAKQTIIPTLTQLHGGRDDFEVVAPEEILQQRKRAQAVLNLVLTCIAAISLIVGGIGVMNIMLANIMERLGEIGLRRAVGARQRDIRNQFLLEAVLVCVVGGVIGIVLGLSLSFVVAYVADLPIAFSLPSVAVAFAISLAVGVVFGLTPALRAARVNPIEALQHG